MQRSFSCAAMGLVISASLGSCETLAQQGNPTALPPGSANMTGSTRPAGTTQPAGPAGTTRPAGGTTPTGRTGTSTPATKLQSRESFERSQMATPATRFGSSVSQPPGARTDSGVIFGQQGFSSGVNNAGVNNNTAISGNRFGGGTTQMMFERNAAVDERSDSSGVGNAASSIPGRPNMSGGSTSRTLRPGARITGDPNDTSMGPGSAPLSRQPSVNNDLFFGGVVSGVNVPLVPLAPIVQFGAGVQEAADAPVALPSQLVPVIVMPTEAQTSGRTGIAASVAVGPRESPIPQEGVATATAYPTRNRTPTGDATLTASPPAANFTVQSQVVKMPAGAAVTTTYRGTRSATAPRSGLTYSHPGYTQWQGHYWHHSLAAGWQYWDGLRWVQFASARN